MHAYICTHDQSQQGDKGEHRIGVEFVTLLYNNYKNPSIQKENQRKFYLLIICFKLKYIAHSKTRNVCVEDNYIGACTGSNYRVGLLRFTKIHHSEISLYTV